MISHMTWASSAFKIKLAVAGYRALTPEITRKAFYESGSWPMDFRFLDRIAHIQASDNLKGPSCSSVNTRNSQAVRGSHLGEIRNESCALLDRIGQLSNGPGSASNALAEIQVLLNSYFKSISCLRHKSLHPSSQRLHSVDVKSMHPLMGHSVFKQGQKNGPQRKLLRMTIILKTMLNRELQ